jgi:hypothetical protein
VGKGLQHSIPVLSYFQSTSLDTQKSSRNHDEALAPLVAACGEQMVVYNNGNHEMVFFSNQCVLVSSG